MQYVLATVLALLLVPNRAEAKEDCAKNPVYCAILKLRPDIDKTFGLELSNYIFKYSKKYGTDPYRSVAIAMQESTLRNIHRKQDVVLIKEHCDSDNVCVEYTELGTGYTDIGIWQFHARTIQAFSMDALRLRDDIEYSTERHTYLLRIKMQECGAALGEDAWSCYHSSTPQYREKYVQMVERYYEQIRP